MPGDSLHLGHGGNICDREANVVADQSFESRIAHNFSEIGDHFALFFPHEERHGHADRVGSQRKLFVQRRKLPVFAGAAAHPLLPLRIHRVTVFFRPGKILFVYKRHADHRGVVFERQFGIGIDQIQQPLRPGFPILPQTVIVVEPVTVRTIADLRIFLVPRITIRPPRRRGGKVNHRIDAPLFQRLEEVTENIGHQRIERNVFRLYRQRFQ